MSLKWTMEAVFAAVAIVASLGGGLYTTVYHSGAQTAQVVALVQHDADQDKKIDATGQSLEAQKLLDAAVAQKLDDFGKQLDRIEAKL